MENLYYDEPEHQYNYDPIGDLIQILPYDNLLMAKGSRNQSFVWSNELISASGDESYNYLQDHPGSPIRLVDGNNPSSFGDYL